jgi:UDP-N-acetylglucosamine--N-acetylmuramyl-(pentapeptide) pyrophosphoryl-undecaprenol N-acetylglucosamine transferase
VRFDRSSSYLLAATPGGHLAQLQRIVEAAGVSREHRVWLTHQSPHARWALRGEEVHFVPAMPSRSYVAFARGLRPAWSKTRELGARCDAAVSTGAAIAGAVLPAARAFGLAAAYIESATRIHGPSLAGRALARVPGIALYCQSGRFRDPRFRARSSVFDAFAVGNGRSDKGLARALVLTGTQEGMPFDHLLRAVQALADHHPELRVRVQSVAPIAPRHPRVELVPFIEPQELALEIAEADTVITHAGVGTLLMCFGAGVCPVVVPRAATRGEHVDAHQAELADDLSERGLIVASLADPEALEAAALAAAQRRVQGP